MDNERSAESPFDAVAQTVGDQTAEAFELLGNETRLAILVALWDATDPTAPITEEGGSGLSFSELYDRVGVQDSGQFNYHLDKLIDKFVEQTDGTYTLTTPAKRILSAIIAGAVTDPPSFTDEPIDTDCYLCGGSVVIDYIDGSLRKRCTNCEGVAQGADDPPGLLMRRSQSPTGLTNRSPQEFFRQGNIVNRHNGLTFYEGVCPNCTGTVTATARICDNHDPGDDSLCPHCRRHNKFGWNFVCDVCEARWDTMGWTPIVTEMAVLSFCYERGLDVYTGYDLQAWRQVNDAVDTTVSSREPLEITVTIELEGDRLTVTLDDDARVIDITETTS